jgi:hypothetical protein
MFLIPILQLEPGQGKWDDLESWQYLSLVKGANGICQLSEARFWCPDGRDALWDFKTGHDLELIKAYGKFIYVFLPFDVPTDIIR